MYRSVLLAARILLVSALLGAGISALAGTDSDRAPSAAGGLTSTSDTWGWG
ncbi:hypothetical protein [Kitasatospora azatica]|uniref:hypothetical protein n=1 Tax=Kitasatospora azatica TaxID=58347 RepID=UPI000A6E6E8E|nr:hypothetical protein [Kitasatospora azatica]